MRSNRWGLAYHVMMMPAMILLLIFSIMPLSGIVIAFEKFIPAKGIFRSKWIGLANFEMMFQSPDSLQILQNTLIIAISKIILQPVVPIVVALMLNEIRSRAFKRT
ncbi:MAG: sugar ABC transporter permease, partial [Clostridia bacterium]|nr:sugar ABC transporter permease [Clostridia bacterium]